MSKLSTILIRYVLPGAAIIAGGALLLAKGRPLTAVVVLGNSDPIHAANRVQATIDIVQAHGADLLIPTGKGAGIGGLPEADWMAQKLTHLNIPMMVENKAGSTASNVTKSALLIPDDYKVIVVSDMDHVQSAAWCLRWVHGKDAYWIQYPNQMTPQFPPQNPANCKRASCCN